MKLLEVNVSEFLCGYFLADEAEFAVDSRAPLNKNDNEVWQKIAHNKN